MRRVLTFDLGNTAAKVTLFEGETPLKMEIASGDDPDRLIPFAEEEGADCAVYCSVRGDNPEFGMKLRESLGIPVTEVTAMSSLPFAVDYGTRGTLGVDRIAAAAGAMARYGGNLLVVDAGTAVTADLIEGATFRGGNISPGLKLRFRSLHEFTGKLPLVSAEGALPGFGKDTDTAIRTGVVRGLVDEIAADHTRASHIYKGIKLVLTGGDADFLSLLLVDAGLNPIVDHNLVGLGLIHIIDSK